MIDPLTITLAILAGGAGLASFGQAFALREAVKERDEAERAQAAAEGKAGHLVLELERAQKLKEWREKHAKTEPVPAGKVVWAPLLNGLEHRAQAKARAIRSPHWGMGPQGVQGPMGNYHHCRGGSIERGAPVTCPFCAGGVHV